jgi:hypothetical protein
MSKEKFLPTKDQLKSTWQKTLGITIPGFTAKYNVQPADVTRIQQGGTYAEFCLDAIEAVENYKKEWVAYKNTMFFGPPAPPAGVDPATVAPPAALVLPVAPAAVPPPGIFPHSVSIGTAIKKNLNYIVDDGNDMGLEGAEKPAPDTVNGKPVFSAVLKGIVVWLLWTKGLFDGVWFEVDRGDGNWVKLGEDYHPDFADTAALPATATTWRYRAWYVMSDENGNAVRVGLVSDIVSITVKA